MSTDTDLRFSRRELLAYYRRGRRHGLIIGLIGSAAVSALPWTLLAYYWPH